MKTFRILPEVRSALRPLTAEEKDGLRISIQTDGCRDALVIGNVLGDRILADGHNRFDICQEDHISFKTVEMKFQTIQLLIEWVKQNQADRRNLDTKEMEAYRMGKRKNQEARSVGRPSETNEIEEKSSHSETISGDTAQRIAEEEGVSRATVERNAQFAEAVDAHGAVDPAAKESILNGTSGMTKAEVIAAAPILCDRCHRVGPIKGCKGCETLRRESKPAKPKPKADGEEITDPHGVVIPKRCRDVWCDPWIQSTLDVLERASELVRLEHIPTGMSKRAKRLPFYTAGDVIDGVGFVIQYLDDVITHLKANRPAAVCPDCAGKGCATCQLSGLVPEAVHEEAMAKGGEA